MHLFDRFTKPTTASRRRASLRFRPQVEGLELRLVPYTTSGNMWPNPQLVTISFMPDGTNLGTTTSNLFSTFNARFGSASTWQNVILKAAQVWAQQTNINFAVVPDSGAPEGGGSYQQGDPTMGDIRIGGGNLGCGTLAQAYMPPPVNNYSLAGDIQFNTDYTFNINGQDYDLFAVAMHEFGHALGMYHSNNSGAVMYPYYQGAKSGLGSDDINGIRDIYSNNNGRSPDAYGGLNNSFSNAATITSSIDPTNLTALVNNLDIATAGQKEYFTATAPAGTGSTVTINVQSQGLSLLAPKLYVYSSSQTLLGSASGYGKYGTTLTLNLTNKISTGQQFYVEVAGADTTAMGTGNYALTMSFAGDPLPTVPLPDTQVANGSPLSGGGGQAMAQAQPYAIVTSTSASQQVALQSPQAVAMDAQGNYVVTWAANNKTNGNWTIYAQRFTATGVPQGGSFQVNAYIQGNAEYPAVARDAAGDFVITWASDGGNGNGWRVYAQRFSATGAAEGSEFQVSTRTGGDQLYPTVAMDATGDFVITWSGAGANGTGWNIYAQRYNAAGAAQGGQFQVNAPTQGDAEHSTVAMDAAGDFAVTWSEQSVSGGVWNVYAERYSAAGAVQWGQFQVNTFTTGDQLDPSVAMDTAGDFVITWSRHGGSSWSVVAQCYDSTGAANGGEFQVDTVDKGDQKNPTVAMNGTGDFLITWSGQSRNAQGRGTWTVMGRQYDDSGAADGDPFPVSATGGDQTLPSIARDQEGHIIVVWNGSGSTGNGVFAQRYVIGIDFLSAPTNDTTTAPASPGQTRVDADSTSTDTRTHHSPGDHRTGSRVSRFSDPVPAPEVSSTGRPETHFHVRARQPFAPQALDAWFAAGDWTDIG